MRPSIIASIFAFAASQVTAQNLNQSAPFYLVLSSRNSTLDGSTLSPCHEGAAIEGLCLAGKLSSTSETYNFNTSTFSTPDPVLGPSGSLNWELHGGNFNLSSPMIISSPVTSNVAVPLFEPSESYTSVGFDSEDKLFVFSYINDTVTPPKYEVSAQYHWYVCLTNSGYTYTTLAWVVGPHSPQNPSCSKVTVKRVFA